MGKLKFFYCLIKISIADLAGKAGPT